MKTKRPRTRFRKPATFGRQARPRKYFCLAGLLYALAACPVWAQTPSSASPPQMAQPAPSVAPAAQGKPARIPTAGDRRRAVKLYLAASKLFENEQLEHAMRGFERAATLDPTNADYPLAAALARSHAVTALIQTAAKDAHSWRRREARAPHWRMPSTRPQKLPGHRASARAERRRSCWGS